MSNSISSAISAYNNLTRAASGEGMEARDVPAPLPGEEFSSVLHDAAKGAVSSLKDAEVQSASVIAGKGDLREMVAAVANAEMTLDTVVTVRDKVVNAYNEIMRMPI